jgi:DNA repair exonuclease SbcCD ATPase subunit
MSWTQLEEAADRVPDHAHGADVLIYELEARVRRLEKELEDKDEASSALCAAIAQYERRLREASADQAERLRLITSLQESVLRLEQEKKQLEDAGQRPPARSQVDPGSGKG